MMTEFKYWDCTDPDNLQYKLRGSLCFREFDRNNFDADQLHIDSDEVPSEIWNDPKYWIQETIDLSNYTLQDILRYALGYYDSLDEMINQHGPSADNIMAEIIFEQENGLY